MARTTLCNHCDRRTCLSSCRPCADVEALLPSPDFGRNMREWIGIAHPDRLLDSPARAALREAAEGRRCLMRLADRYRNLLSEREHLAATLVWGLGCSLNEAAARLGVSKSRVQICMHRALGKLYGVVLGAAGRRRGGVNRPSVKLRRASRQDAKNAKGGVGRLAMAVLPEKRRARQWISVNRRARSGSY